MAGNLSLYRRQRRTRQPINGRERRTPKLVAITTRQCFLSSGIVKVNQEAENMRMAFRLLRPLLKGLNFSGQAFQISSINLAKTRTRGASSLKRPFRNASILTRRERVTRGLQNWRHKVGKRRINYLRNFRSQGFLLDRRRQGWCIGAARFCRRIVVNRLLNRSGRGRLF